jgi:FHA domain/Cysteine-rich secretory protein family
MGPGTGRAKDARKTRRSSAKARLVTLDAAAAREYPLRGRSIAVGGASDNDIVVAGKSVSRHHARIIRKLGRYQLADLESTNGSFVNGRRVRALVTLRRGDEIRFGTVRFAYLPGRAILRAPQPWGIRIGFGTIAGMLLLLFLVGFSATEHYLSRPRESAAPAAASTISAARPTAAPAAAPTTRARASAAAPAPSATAEAKASPTALPTAAAAPPGEEYDWLRALDSYRAMVKLPPVQYDAGLSAADASHVAYLIENYAASLRAGKMPGAAMHAESSGRPGYSAEGQVAARHSDIDFLWTNHGALHASYTWALTDWMTGAFHRLPLLSPRLRRAGYAQQCDSGLCVAALNAQTGVEPPPPGGMLLAQPIAFPPDGATLDLRTFETEWPDPLAACAGYARPSGLPITLQFGAFRTVRLEKYSVTREGGGEVEACGFDSSSYTNPDPYAQQDVRGVLFGYATVVVIPRRPLRPGATYQIAVTVNEKSYEWRFTIQR